MPIRPVTFANVAAVLTVIVLLIVGVEQGSCCCCCCSGLQGSLHVTQSFFQLPDLIVCVVGCVVDGAVGPATKQAKEPHTAQC